MKKFSSLLVLSLLFLNGCGQTVEDTYDPASELNYKVQEQLTKQEQEIAQKKEEASYIKNELGSWKEFKLENRSLYFQYPAKWELDCCGDMDGKSAHAIYSAPNQDSSHPYIILIEYAPWGCSVPEDECTLNNIEEIPSAEFVNKHIAKTPADALILPKRKLKHIAKEAFVYKETYGDSENLVYVIDTGRGMITVEFREANNMISQFIDYILDSIEMR